jgi:hypothetical protein
MSKSVEPRLTLYPGLEYAPSITDVRYRVNQNPTILAFSWNRPARYGSFVQTTVSSYEYKVWAYMKNGHGVDLKVDWTAINNGSATSHEVSIPEFKYLDENTCDIVLEMRAVWRDGVGMRNYSDPANSLHIPRGWSYNFPEYQRPTQLDIEEDGPDNSWAHKHSTLGAKLNLHFDTPQRLYDPNTNIPNGYDNFADKARVWNGSRDKTLDISVSKTNGVRHIGYVVISTGVGFSELNFDGGTENHPSIDYEMENWQIASNPNYTPTTFTSNPGSSAPFKVRPAHKPEVASLVSVLGTDTLYFDVDKGDYSETQWPKKWFYRVQKNNGSWSGWRDCGLDNKSGGRVTLDNVDYCTKYSFQTKYTYDYQYLELESYTSTVRSVITGENDDYPVMTIVDGPINLCDEEKSVVIEYPEGVCGGRDFDVDKFRYTIDGGYTQDWKEEPQYIPGTDPKQYSAKIDTGWMWYPKRYSFRLFSTDSVTGVEQERISYENLSSPTKPSIILDYDPDSPDRTGELIVEATNCCDNGLMDFEGFVIQYKTRIVGTSTYGPWKIFYRTETLPEDCNKSFVIDFEENTDYVFNVKTYYNKSNQPMVSSKSVSMSGDTELEFWVSNYDVSLVSDYPVNYWNAGMSFSVETASGVVQSKYYESLTDQRGKMFYGSFDETNSLPMVFGHENNFSPDLNWIGDPKDTFTLGTSKIGGENITDPLEGHVLV